jgi:hypothetical protein
MPACGDILTLPFSTALLGALDTAPGGQDPNVGGNDDQWCGGEKEVLPMQSWALWWFIRTYLQSLGQVVPSSSPVERAQGCLRRFAEDGGQMEEGRDL